MQIHTEFRGILGKIYFKNTAEFREIPRNSVCFLKNSVFRRKWKKHFLGHPNVILNLINFFQPTLVLYCITFTYTFRTFLLPFYVTDKLPEPIFPNQTILQLTWRIPPRRCPRFWWRNAVGSALWAVWWVCRTGGDPWGSSPPSWGPPGTWPCAQSHCASSGSSPSWR